MAALNEKALEAAIEAGRNAYWDKGGANSYSRSVVAAVVHAAIAAYLHASEPDAVAVERAALARLRELLEGEPDYKLTRWTANAPPWRYWSKESIEAALAGEQP